MEALNWKVSNKGDHVAEGLNGQYLVAYEGNGKEPPGADVYQVRFAGYPIGKSSTERNAKRVAQRHNDR